MYRICFKAGLFFFFSLYGLLANAQNLALANQEKTVTIQELSGVGYEAIVDFDYKSVKKDFWRFCNGFAKLENMRKYYEVIVPPASEEANASIKIWVELKPLKARTQIRALLNPEDMDSATKTKNQSSADKLIREFKIFFYQKWIQGNFAIIEKENAKLSRREQKLKQRIDRAKEKGSTGPKLKSLETAKTQVSNKLSQGLARLEQLKAKLGEVK